LDPMKGVETLIRALSLRTGVAAHSTLVIAGTGKTRYMTRLRAEADSLGVSDRVRWLGALSDMSAFYSAIDVLCLPSEYGEGTSNVIAEALACGCPCAATRVGDAAELLHDPSVLAVAGNPADLLRALDAAVNGLDATSRDSLRSAILRKLPFAATVDATESAMREAISRRAGGLAEVVR